MDTAPKRTAGAWYLIGVGLIIAALSLGTVAWTVTRNSSKQFAIPSTTKVTLAEGVSMITAERDGIPYRCTLDESNRKQEIHRSPDGYLIAVSEPGEYSLVCDANEPLVITVGRGTNAAKIVLLVGGVPAAIGLAVILFVFILRRRRTG